MILKKMDELLLDCPAYHAVEAAERIRKSVENTDFHISAERAIKITVSIGIAAFPEFVPDPEKLPEKADAALYEAKRTGRNERSFINKK